MLRVEGVRGVVWEEPTGNRSRCFSFGTSEEPKVSRLDTTDELFLPRQVSSPRNTAIPRARVAHTDAR
jgi:hypothetical protein